VREREREYCDERYSVVGKIRCSGKELFLPTLNDRELKVFISCKPVFVLNK